MMDRVPAETYITQQLREHLNTFGKTFGSTPTGIDWCVKALHPSDPLTEVRGIPDRSAVPTLCMNYQTTSTLTIAPGQTTPWSFDLTLLPSPVFFAYWEGTKAYDPAANRTVEGNFLNSQLAPTGATAVQACAAWEALARRWRLCYMSATIIQDGPDLANQGTIAVCQSTFEPRITTYGAVDANYAYCYKKIAYFDRAKEGPNFERAQGMPNAMIGRSRDGAYVPLKLTDTCQEWQSEADHVVPMAAGFTFASPASGQVRVPTNLTQEYPYPIVYPFYGTPGVLHGDWVPGLLNGNVAHVSARNLSDQTSFTIQFRFGVEIQLDPASTLTPQLKLSPPYDPVALDTYFAIARELKDAYPASYNCDGKMWNAIRGALKMIAPPLLMAIPGGKALIPAVGPALDAATAIGSQVRRNRQQRKTQQQQQGSQMSRRELRRQRLAQAAGTARLAAQAMGPLIREAQDQRNKQLAVTRTEASIERARANRDPARPVTDASTQDLLTF